MKVVRTVYWFTIAILATLLGAFYLPGFWLLKRFRKEALHRKLVFKYARWWGRTLVAATGSKVTALATDSIPSGPVVFMGNHLGIFDIMTILGFLNRPLAFIAKKELAKAPIVSNLMKHVGCLFLDRQDVRQAAMLFRQATAQVQGGLSMVIFPEGTRSVTTEVADFKSGSMKLATKANVPIVPIAIQGTDKVFENNGHRIGPSQISIQVMPAILPEEYREMGTNHLAQKVHSLVAGWQRAVLE